MFARLGLGAPAPDALRLARRPARVARTLASRLAGFSCSLAAGSGPQPWTPCGSHGGPLASLGSDDLELEPLASRLAGPSPLASLGSDDLELEPLASRLAGPSPPACLGSGVLYP